jgi:hypothetical protein
MGLLSYKRNDDRQMLLCEWKVKGEIASVFIIGYRPKGWVSVRISGRLITGSSTALTGETMIDVCMVVYYKKTSHQNSGEAQWMWSVANSIVSVDQRHS